MNFVCVFNTASDIVMRKKERGEGLHRQLLYYTDPDTAPNASHKLYEIGTGYFHFIAKEFEIFLTYKGKMTCQSCSPKKRREYV